MTKGKAHGRNSQGFKPDLGNSAVRHYRGASENVAMVEMRSQLAIERAGLVTPHLQPARRSSIPTKTPTDGRNRRRKLVLWPVCNFATATRDRKISCKRRLRMPFPNVVENEEFCLMNGGDPVPDSDLGRARELAFRYRCKFVDLHDFKLPSELL